MSNDPQRVAFEQSKRDSELSTRCLLAAFAYLGVPSSFVDYGCGPGHLVELAYKLGASSTGVDLYVEERSTGFTLLRRDLIECYTALPSAMVVCWELAEHLPVASADNLCRMLASSTDKYLLFSAATPGQTGSGHVNEQVNEYWIDKLEQLGLSIDKVRTSELRRMLSVVAPGTWWYGQNMLVFTKER